MKFGERVFDRTDPQQFRVYAAERATPFGRGAHFESMAEMRADMERIMALPVWAALSRHTLQEGRDVALRRGRGRGGKARVFLHDTPRIIMPPHRWTRWTLIHELAHCVRGRMTCTHGPQFTASYLRLLHDGWSPELAVRLRENFAKHNVRVAPWWEPGAPVPVPDPERLALRLDEGAEEEMAQYERDLREAKAELREALVQFFTRHGLPLPDSLVDAAAAEPAVIE